MLLPMQHVYDWSALNYEETLTNKFFSFQNNNAKTILQLDSNLPEYIMGDRTIIRLTASWK